VKCPFCSFADEKIVEAGPLAVIRRDGFPLSPGHLLIVPRRHVASLFETSPEERSAIFALIDRAKNLIEQEYKPDGYNVGINDGVAAGQTVMHLHVHVIPRYAGDVADPRGGIRWIIPGKAAYWNDK